MAKNKPRHIISINIRQDALDFLDEQVTRGAYSSRSHGVTWALLRQKEEMDREEDKPEFEIDPSTFEFRRIDE